MSFKDVEGQGRDDNPFRKKKKKEFKFSHCLFFFGNFLFLIFDFLGKIRKARLSHSLNRLSVVLNCIVIVKLWPGTGYR